MEDDSHKKESSLKIQIPRLKMIRSLFVLGLTGVALAADWNATQPRQVHLALTEDPSGMLFSWVTGTPIYLPPPGAGTPNATHPTVKIGTTSGVYTRSVTSNYSLQYKLADGLTGDVTHRVNISGLTPRTRYYYIVGDSVLDQWSEREYDFYARPETGPEEVLDLIAYGDMGFWNGSSTLVQAAITAEINSGVRDYAMTVHMGDISYSGLESQKDISKDTELWDLFMSEIEPISAHTPYMVGVGNHDSLPGDSGIECGAVYLHRFKMPTQNESDTDFSCATSTNTRYWWSLTTGPIWLHMWSTEHSYTTGTSQRAWIEQDLAAAKAAKAAGKVSWIIVVMHYPSYCSHTYNGGGGCIDPAPVMRKELEALWVSVGVDVIMFGHIHAAEHTFPVINAVPTQLNFHNPKAPVHFLIGMAGAGYLGPWQTTQPNWSAWRNQVYGWTRWHVEGSKRLDFFFYSYNNGTAPNYTLSITRS